MVQPKLDRSDSVLFSRVRPAIQYRSSTDRLDGRGRFQVTCRLLTAAAATAAAATLTATQLIELVYNVHNSVVVCICLLVLSWAALNSHWLCTELASALGKHCLTPATCV